MISRSGGKQNAGPGGRCSWRQKAGLGAWPGPVTEAGALVRSQHSVGRSSGDAFKHLRQRETKQLPPPEFSFPGPLFDFLLLCIYCLGLSLCSRTFTAAVFVFPISSCPVPCLLSFLYSSLLSFSLVSAFTLFAFPANSSVHTSSLLLGSLTPCRPQGPGLEVRLPGSAVTLPAGW